MDVPDIFASRQGRAMWQAFAAGDETEVERLRAHLVAETSTTPEGAAFLDRFTRGLILHTRTIRAIERGDTQLADAYREELMEAAGRDVATLIVASSYLRAGLDQGWLPPEQHDQLTAAVAHISGPDIGLMVASIRRGRPEDTPS